MATLLDALDQENLDNQREVVKNEKRQSYDNRPYGSFYEKLMAAVFPPDHPYHHTPIGSMADLDAASLDDVTTFFRPWYAPNNAVLTIVGDVDEDEPIRGRGALFGPIPANPNMVRRGRTDPARHRPRGPRDGPRRRAPGCASISATAARRSARPSSTRSRWAPRSWPAGEARVSIGAWCAS